MQRIWKLIDKIYKQIMTLFNFSLLTEHVNIVKSTQLKGSVHEAGEAGSLL